MTVASEITRKEYAGDGSTVAFPTTFDFADNADLKVILVDNVGTGTLQVLTTHYTVTGAGSGAGGTVTMLSAPLSTDTLVILRDAAPLQSSNYVNNDAFPAEAHEGALDKLTYLAQRLKHTVNRSIRLADGEIDAVVDLELPISPAGYRSKIFGTDSAGKAKLYTLNELSAAATIIKNFSVQQFATDGVQTDFILTATAGSEDNTQCFVNGLYQRKTLYTVNIDPQTGDTIQFASAPASGTLEVVVGTAIDIGTPSDGTVTAVKLATDAVQASKLHPTHNTFEKGADVASATTITLGSDGSYFDITGSTTITAIISRRVGAIAKLHFDSDISLTHHATNLILPGGVDMAIKAGTEMEFLEYEAGKWRCTNQVPTEGLWTPSLQDSSFSDAEGQTYQYQYGSYSRIGNRLFFNGSLQLTSLGSLTGADFAFIGGLPFTVRSQTGAGSAASVAGGSSMAIPANTSVTGLIAINTTRIALQKWSDTTGTTPVTITEVSNGAILTLSGHYEIE